VCTAVYFRGVLVPEVRAFSLGPRTPWANVYDIDAGLELEPKLVLTRATDELLTHVVYLTDDWMDPGEVKERVRKVVRPSRLQASD